MWESSAEVLIEAPVETVYRRLADFGRHSDFSDGLASVEQVTPGTVGVGTRFRSEEVVPARYVSYCEITALDEPRLIAWKAWVEKVMRTEWEFRLAPADTGTRLVQVSRWSAAGPIGFLMLNLHRKRNAPKENRRSLERIKSVIEAETAGSASHTACAD